MPFPHLCFLAEIQETFCPPGPCHLRDSVSLLSFNFCTSQSLAICLFMCTSCLSDWELLQAKAICLIRLSLPSSNQKSQHIVGSPKYVLNSIDICNRMLGQRINLHTCWFFFFFSSKRDDRSAIGHLKKTKFLDIVEKGSGWCMEVESLLEAFGITAWRRVG